jgi:DNA-binding IclR family transcriptional regulator
LDSLHDCQNQVRGILLPYLVDLYEAARETVHLCVLDEDAAICVERLGGSRSVPIGTRAGERMPLHCTAAGKILLAYAPESVRRRQMTGPLRGFTRSTITSPVALSGAIRRAARDGCAFDREEFVPGLTSVAVPVMGPDGATAALSVTGPVTEFEPLRVVARIRHIAAVATQELLLAG